MSAGTPLAVIAEPELAAIARNRIDRLRRRFDPRHGLVPLHLTLVFPTLRAEPAEAAQVLLAAMRRSAGAIAARLSGAERIRTPGHRGWFVVLRVTGSSAALARLHTHLSRGPFRGNRHGHGPYRPHVTVAARLTAEEAHRVRRLARGTAVAVRLRHIALVSWDGLRLETLMRCRLGASRLGP